MSASSLDLTEARVGEVGGKAATLARLRGAGFAVPEGVVIGADALREWTPGAPPPASIQHAVRDALSLLGRGPLAVRSSAVEEDGAGSTFAGLFTTTLDVFGEQDVLAAIERCLSSSAAAPVVTYRGGQSVGMAILLQTMIQPEVAGIAFTADPVTGDRDVVRVSGVRGIGEAVASGEATPDEWDVRGDQPARRADAGPPALTAVQVTKVAAVARHIEETLGAPQDVEWAIVDGDVVVLQARPITVLPTPPSESLPGPNWSKDAAHFPEPITPFGASLYVEICDTGITGMCDAYGLMVKGMESRVIGGEVYSRFMPAIGSAESTSAPPPAFVLGLAARFVPSLRKRMKTAQRAVASGLLEDWPHRWIHELRPEFVERIEHLLDVRLDALSDDQLTVHGEELAELYRHGVYVHFQLTVPYFVALHRLYTAANELLAWDASRTIGLLDSPASHATRELDGIRAAIAASADLQRSLNERPSEPVGVLSQYDRATAGQLHHWMDRQAWRTANYDAGSPALAERPGLVTRILLNRPSRGADTDRDELAKQARSKIAPGRAAEFDEALATARLLYPIREDNVILTDNVPCGLLRRWLLDAGRRLVDRGHIARVDDAAFLTFEEITACLRHNNGDSLSAASTRRRAEWAWTRAHPGPMSTGPAVASPDVSRLPAAGRMINAAVLWAMEHEFPTDEPQQAPGDDLAGAPASPGTYTGPARVILGEQDFAKLMPGDVLICRVTTPSWSVLFSLAGGIVTDGGGVLSHAAIVAREHGIPAVLGTGAATTRIRNGDLVHVDGGAGIARVLQRRTSTSSHSAEATQG